MFNDKMYKYLDIVLSWHLLDSNEKYKLYNKDGLSLLNDVCNMIYDKPSILINNQDDFVRVIDEIWRLNMEWSKSWMLATIESDKYRTTDLDEAKQIWDNFINICKVPYIRDTAIILRGELE